MVTSLFITVLPAVVLDAPKRDWADWGTWGFNALLVVVGVLQVLLLLFTLRFIRKQTREMRRQRVLMRKQWGEMWQQTASLKDYVEETKKIAKSTVDNANIAASVSVPRLVIDKFEQVVGLADLRAMLQFPKVKVVIKNYGQTPAFLKSWNIIFTCEELPLVPDYWNQPGQPGVRIRAAGIMLEREVVEPNQPYTLPELMHWHRTEFSPEDVQAIIDRKKQLWCYGFICYHDLFGNPPQRFKFCEYALNVMSGGVQWVEAFFVPAYRGTDDYPLTRPIPTEAEPNASA